MSVQSTGVYTSQPVIQSSGYSMVIPRIIENISKVALPAIALFAMANLQVANAGPISYALCVESCFAATLWCPPLMPACVFGCFPLLGVPFPP